jgi:hypothetical protein
MGMREEKKQFETEREAQDYADRMKSSALPGYSEVYVTGPYNICGVWMVEYKEYYG